MPASSKAPPAVRADTSSRSAFSPKATTLLAPFSTQPVAVLAAVAVTLFSS